MDTDKIVYRCACRTESRIKNDSDYHTACDVAEKKRAVNQIKDDISDIAISIAEKVVSKEIDPKTHDELIDSFIDSIGE